MASEEQIKDLLDRAVGLRRTLDVQAPVQALIILHDPTSGAIGWSHDSGYAVADVLCRVLVQHCGPKAE
jgi:hypothetical protein